MLLLRLFLTYGQLIGGNVKMDQPKKRITKKSATGPKKDPPKAGKKVSPEERMKMIEQAAYYIAEKDGFKGDPHAYWVAAETQINGMLGK